MSIAHDFVLPTRCVTFKLNTNLLISHTLDLDSKPIRV